MMTKRQLSNGVKDVLKLNDFRAVGVGAGVVSLIKKDNILKEEIIISYTKVLGGYKLAPYVSAWKTFDSVNSILKKHFEANFVPYQEYTIHSESRRIEDIWSIPILEVSDLEEIKDALMLLVVNDILPFFSMYETLEDVHSRVVELEVDELANFVANPPHPRIMVIKRLVNAYDWESFCEGSIEMYKEQSEGKYRAVFEPIYRFLPDLYEELKQIDHPA